MLQKNPAAQLLLLPPSIGREAHFLQTAQECKWNDEEEDKSDRKWKEECEGQKGDDDSAEENQKRKELWVSFKFS